MNYRVISHYQTPMPIGFDEYVIRHSGLSEDDQKLVWDLRKHTGNTQFYADRAGMTLKQYSERIGKVHRRMIGELLRLAQIGWEIEKAHP